ncbi:MAG: hypothetical protein RMI91_15000 [Gemmatales bacterium]|nr:hypothetical protein [Gemmatales bacterium]
MSAVRIMLAAVRRVGAFRGLSFEAFGDLAVSLSIALRLAMLSLGVLMTPDETCVFAEAIGPAVCKTDVCTTNNCVYSPECERAPRNACKEYTDPQNCRGCRCVTNGLFCACYPVTRR